MKIINLSKFKEVVTNSKKSELKALLEYLAFHRIICELVLVDIFNIFRENGEAVPKSETLTDYSNTLECEHILIGLLGRKESAKVYGVMEGITSDVKTVDYILTNNSVKYYKELIAKSQH